MTLCTECKLQYSEHSEGDLLKCNRRKDMTILDLRLKTAFDKDQKSHTQRLSS